MEKYPVGDIVCCLVLAELFAELIFAGMVELGKQNGVKNIFFA